jgi:iron complex outermembrane recepter protein
MGAFVSGAKQKLKSRPRRFRNEAVVSALAIAIGLGAVLKINAQEIKQAIKQAAATPTATVPEIVVTAPKPKPKVARTPRAAGASAVAANTQPAEAASGTGTGPNGTIVPLQTVVTVDKTGTPLANLPQSVVVVPRATIVEQGGTSVADAVRNVSGVNIGGSSTYGFFDRFTIRGMDARFYSDNFPDGDQSNGFPHSLNGVERVEVLKGPGSALFGSGPPGGSVNVVHFAPSAVPGYGLSQQVGSFGSWTTSAYATGPTTIPGLNYRVDGLLAHSDGFRNLESANYEIRPVLQWNKDNHVTTFALDYRHIERTPDPYGLVYFNGAALAGAPLNVPNTFKYSTPFSFGNQDFARATLTDTWWFADYLTINNRLAFTYRDVSILRNSGGGNIFFSPVTNTWQQGAAACPSSTASSCRQLREQTDLDNDFVYQFEPVWKFHTGTVFHTLLTGAQVEWQSIDDQRATANLPNITNIFAPVIPETSIAGLTFLRDATHSGMVDQLRALYLSAYTVDQIDVTDQWKVRLSARQDHWYEQLTPLAFVSGRVEDNGVTPLEPGTVERRIDQPTSWSVGTLYKILPTVAPFAGVSKSYLTNFNSEATSQGIVAPESGLEYEAGIKFSTPDNRIILTTAAFDIQRTNVFTENTVTGQVAFNAQKSYGFDADLQMLITPQWTVLANMISQTARLTAVPLTPAQVGNWPVGVPAHIYNIWSTYDFAIAGIKGFRVGAGLSYNGATFGTTADNVWIPSSTVADAMFGYYANNWDAQIGVKNITNVTYFTTAQSAGGYVGQPRTFYAKAAWHY